MTITMSLKMDAVKFGKNEASIFLAKNPYFRKWDRDFFDSEAFLAFSKGLSDYDDTRGVNIVSFLKTRIRHRLTDVVRKGNRLGGYDIVMLRKKGEEINGMIDFRFVMDSLEGRDREIFYLYFVEGKSMKKIGGIFGISPSRVHELLNGRIKKKIIGVLGDAGI